MSVLCANGVLGGNSLVYKPNDPLASKEWSDKVRDMQVDWPRKTGVNLLFYSTTTELDPTRGRLLLPAPIATFFITVLHFM